MSSNPPFSINQITTVADADDADADHAFEAAAITRGEFDPRKHDPQPCLGEDRCMVQSIDEDTHLDHGTLEHFDKWELRQCRLCGGFRWVRTQGADRL